MEREGC